MTIVNWGWLASPHGLFIKKIQKGQAYQDVLPLFRSTSVAKKTITSITSSGGVATVTSPNHGYTTGDSVGIDGADQAEYNGTFTITVTDANTYTYSITGSPASPATTSGTLQSGVWSNPDYPDFANCDVEIILEHLTTHQKLASWTSWGGQISLLTAVDESGNTWTPHIKLNLTAIETSALPDSDVSNREDSYYARVYIYHPVNVAGLERKGQVSQPIGGLYQFLPVS